MQGLALRRRWWVFLLAAGLGAGLLSIVPAHGGQGEADYLAGLSACVGSALDRVGLQDIRGLNAEDDINCIAHYGITRGRTATMFAPREYVSRWQMALFLYRAAGPAGIVVPNPARDLGFVDIGGLSPEAREAVNALAQLGIMPGSGNRFNPNALVTRVSMAVLIHGFLRQSLPGPWAFGQNPDDLATDRDLRVDSIVDIEPDPSVFTDTDDLNAGQYRSIERLFELGVTTGKTATSFAPNDPVTRAQMASFIARALAHTNARPSGVSVQAAPATIRFEPLPIWVSVRDIGFNPVPDARVDLFWLAGSRNPRGTNGFCSSDARGAGGGDRLCVIDVRDHVTGAGGNLGLTISRGGGSGTVWAWTGRTGDRFAATPSRLQGSLTLGSEVRRPARLILTDNLAENQTTLRFGEPLTFTLQVTDDQGDPFPRKDWSVQIHWDLRSASSQSSSETRTHFTDSSGQIVLRFDEPVPASRRVDTSELCFNVFSFSVMDELGHVAPFEDRSTSGSRPVGEDEQMCAATRTVTDEDDGTTTTMSETIQGIRVTWSNEPPRAALLDLQQAVPYHIVPEDGGRVRNTITARVLDQYGDLYNPRNARTDRVLFDSDDPDGIGRLVSGSGGLFPRTLLSRGATLSYRRDGDFTGVEFITAELESDRDVRGETEHYWVKHPTISSGSPISGELLWVDFEANQLVFHSGRDTWLVSYDNNDRFLDGDRLGLEMAEFEDRLRVGSATISVYRYADDPQPANRIGVGL